MNREALILNRFCFRLSQDFIDVGKCACCGQMFRWNCLSDGRWLGQDGDLVYLVKTNINANSTHLEVEANASLNDFSKLFRMDCNWKNQVNEVLVRGPELGKFLDSFIGIRTMHPQSVVESIFSFLCTPNNNIKRITSMVQKLARYGPSMGTTEGYSLYAFPTLDVLATIGEAELRNSGFGYRAKTIPLVAQKILERGGLSYLQGLRIKCCYEEIIEEFLSLPGIGPKLADCIALFAFHCGYAVPFDTHLWKKATSLYFPQWAGSSLTNKKYDEAGDFFRHRFGEFAGLAHHILFLADLNP